MKRSIALIILFAVSLGSSVAQLFRLSRKQDTLEAQVSDSLKTLYKLMTEYPELENIPEWLGTGTIESARHFQDYGMAFYDIKTAVYYLTITAVIIMFLGKKSGFWIYVTAQVLAILAVIYALGINAVSILVALCISLVAALFIFWYKKLFLNKLEN